MHTGGKTPEEVVPELLKYFDPEEQSTRGRIIQIK